MIFCRYFTLWLFNMENDPFMDEKTYIYLLRMAIYAIAMLNNHRVTRFSYGYESIVEWTSIYQLF